MSQRTHGLLVLVVLLATSVFLRVIFLRTTPAIFSHDEVHYIDEAQSIALSGSDLTGSWRPWYLRPTSVLYAELPSTIMSPGSLLFSDPFWKARAVSVFLGVLLPVVIAGIAWSLTRKKEVFWTTLIVSLFNPWIFQFSRLSFDPLFSLFFYSLGIFCLIALRPRWRMISLLPFFLGFFQYQGLKIIFLPLVVITTGYVIWRDCSGTSLTLKSVVKTIRSQLWDVLLVAIFGLALFGFYIVRLPSQNAGQRLHDILFFNETYLSQHVNDQRRIALADPVVQVSTNKVTVIIQEFLIKYFQTFDLSQLFVRGESVRNPFSVWTRGIFFPIDVLLIGAAIFALATQKKWRKEGLLLIGFVLISPLPVALNSIDTWVMFRGSWLVVSLLLMIGIGAWQLIQAWPKILLVGVGVVYLITVVSFTHEYFIHYPIYSTKGSGFAERVLSNYIQRLPKDKKVVVLVDESRFVFESYLAYNNLVTQENLPAIHKAMTESVYKLGNVEFTTDCLDQKLVADGTIVINSSVNVTCDQKPFQLSNTHYAKIASLIDNGAQFTIYIDSICVKYALRPYTHVTNRKFLDAEKLSEHDFCDGLLSKPIE